MIYIGGEGMSKMYTVKEVAEKLKISEGTVRNYLSQGKLKYVKVFGNTRIILYRDWET